MTLFYRQNSHRKNGARRNVPSHGKRQTDQQTVWCQHCGRKGIQIGMEFCGTSYFRQLGRKVQHFRCPVDSRHHRCFVNVGGRREELVIDRSN